ncbi:MAG: UDP-N-acetylmuramoyl-L-alanine--D-glutamate ligase [Acidimicrobiia bacterium]
MRVLVLGSGVSGIAAARLAVARGDEVLLYDDRVDAEVPEDLAISSQFGSWSGRLLDDVGLVVTSPGFSPLSPPLLGAEDRGIPIKTEVGFALEGETTPYIAVTGTNGKSTVTEVTTSMLVHSGVDAVAAGNIGTPVAGIVPIRHEMAVLELSSFQLHYLIPRPQAATIINIAPDHLDWHGSFDAYVAAKAHVVADMDPSGTVAFNADDAVVTSLMAEVEALIVPCSGDRVPRDGNGVDGAELVIDDRRFSSPITDPSYRLDLVVAGTLALACGAVPDGVQAAIDAFEPGAHRRRVVATINGVVWVDDSKATNPHATVAAASAFSSVRLLAGGRNKDLDLSPIGRIDTVRALYAFGESGPDLAKHARVPTTIHATMRDAIDAAAADAEPDDVVLLSPGCTSFDEFSSYAERGRVFSEVVVAMNGTAET